MQLSYTQLSSRVRQEFARPLISSSFLSVPFLSFQLGVPMAFGPCLPTLYILCAVYIPWYPAWRQAGRALALDNTSRDWRWAAGGGCWALLMASFPCNGSAGPLLSYCLSIYFAALDWVASTSCGQRSHAARCYHVGAGYRPSCSCLGWGLGAFRSWAGSWKLGTSCARLGGSREVSVAMRGGERNSLT